jgi:hypothetical protein
VLLERNGILLTVDDVVAVCVELEGGGRRYFVTWGRIQSAVDPGPLEALVLRHSTGCSLGGVALRARVCPTMREAAMSEDAPYFFESYRNFASVQIPFGNEYDEWRNLRAAAMESGREISYCGRPC